MAEKTVEFVPLDSLELDPENPRLPESLERTQQAMREYIARETSIEELMSVIAANGYFKGEPLIVYKKNRKFRVIEGNRRNRSTCGFSSRLVSQDGLGPHNDDRRG